MKQLKKREKDLAHVVLTDHTSKVIIGGGFAL
jgi:hypothetical protein